MLAAAEAAGHTYSGPIDLAWPTADPSGDGRTDAPEESPGIKVDPSAQTIPAPGEPPRPSDAPKIEGVPQYKVLGQKDHSTSAKFNLSGWKKSSTSMPQGLGCQDRRRRDRAVPRRRP